LLGPAWICAEPILWIDGGLCPRAPCGRLEHFPGCDLIGVDLDELLPVGADPAAIPHQAHGPGEIPLDHQRVKAPDPQDRIDPVQD
jgi:hypothetical protein